MSAIIFQNVMSWIATTYSNVPAQASIMMQSVLQVQAQQSQKQQLPLLLAAPPTPQSALGQNPLQSTWLHSFSAPPSVPEPPEWQSLSRGQRQRRRRAARKAERERVMQAQEAHNEALTQVLMGAIAQAQAQPEPVDKKRKREELEEEDAGRRVRDWSVITILDSDDESELPLIKKEPEL